MIENKLPIIKWLKDETEDQIPESPIIRQNLINGILYHFPKVTDEESKDLIRNFFQDNPERLQTVIDNIPSDTELINYSEVFNKPINSMDLETINEVGRKCKFCSNVLVNPESKYCNEICQQGYINNIINLWEIEPEKTEKDLLIDTGIRFRTLIRNADPEELYLRIKILNNILVEATALAYSQLSREEIRAKVESDTGKKAVVKKLVSDRDSAKIEDVEYLRKLNEVKKSGEKINPAVKQGARSGKCLYCDTETLKETCSSDCKNSWKLIQHWMKAMGINEDKARKMVAETMNKLGSPVVSESKETVN